MSARPPRAEQNPTSDRGSFDPNMLLAYVPSERSPGAPPPPKFGTLIFETNMDGVEVFLDGQSVGIVNKSKPLEAARPAARRAHHQGRARMGYEPDGPREEMVYPGQESTVSIKILIPRRRRRGRRGRSSTKGLEYYKKGYEKNYTKAAEHFEKALAADPTYSQAAMYLGRTYNALFDQDEAEASTTRRPSRSTRTTWRRAPVTAACCWTSATWTKPSGN